MTYDQLVRRVRKFKVRRKPSLRKRLLALADDWHKQGSQQPMDDWYGGYIEAMKTVSKELRKVLKEK